MWLSVLAYPSRLLSFLRGAIASLLVCTFQLTFLPVVSLSLFIGAGFLLGSWEPCKMRFGRLGTTDDEEGGRKGLPIRLPMMKRNRQSVLDTKENIPPELDDDHGTAIPSTKASRRRTVIDFFKHKGGHKAEAENENEKEDDLTRMSTQRTKSVSLQTGVSFNVPAS
jgi:hypothetical protein